MRHFDLPLAPEWTSEEEYVEALLTFVTTNTLFRNLCGGVHVLDFLTREPDLYTTVLPAEWRAWLEDVNVHDVLHLLLRANIRSVQQDGVLVNEAGVHITAPPPSLLEYITNIRSLSLDRTFHPDSTPPVIPRHVSVGMKPKKSHEVSHFSAFINQLSQGISSKLNQRVSLVDFGSGQNYLGRTLTSPPYNKHVIAIERKHHNVAGAKGMDVHAKLSKKEKIMRNKKVYKMKLAEAMENGLPTPPEEALNELAIVPERVVKSLAEEAEEAAEAAQITSPPGLGSMTYINHDIINGDLDSILYPTTSSPSSTSNNRPPLITLSLHSCGNLSHHALRTMTSTPSVAAVAIIGCCYNLLTERLSPPTYKHPRLPFRSNHPRLVETGSARDPDGFPMSQRLENFVPAARQGVLDADVEKGVRLNITARMMAVQAPQNWGRTDSEDFFTRHFYRALLQRMLFDVGVVTNAESTEDVEREGGGICDGWNGRDGYRDSSAEGGEDAAKKGDEKGRMVIVGSLKKSAFASFSAYCQTALEKLRRDEVYGADVSAKTAAFAPEVVKEYEANYAYSRKELAVIWSLMAFSAGVVESAIAVDRWLFLKEQEEVERAEVRCVWSYELSPRNLCVVGWKKRSAVRLEKEAEVDRKQEEKGEFRSTDNAISNG